MNTHPLSPAARRRRFGAGLLALSLVVGAFAVQQSLAAASDALLADRDGASGAAGAADPVLAAPDGTVTAADGLIVEGQEPSVFDDASPAVVNLDPALLDAVRRAAEDAAADGVEFVVNSGWRSAEHQEQLLRDAVAFYGSAEEAARWVATAETSEHVSGDAVDIGPLRALDWLAQHGSAYGLCQIYANEPWHYELRPDAVESGCPQMYNDPTDDPRMHG